MRRGPRPTRVVRVRSDGHRGMRRALTAGRALWRAWGKDEVIGRDGAFGTAPGPRKFVNSAWGWTCTFLGGFVLLVVFLATRRVAVTARHLSRLVVGAAVWRGAGRAFLLIEDLTGSCLEPLPQGLLLHELPDRRSCLAAGHQWRGYTVSSHTFLLTFCCLLMAEEAAVFARYLAHGLPAGAPLRLVFLLNVLLLALWNFLLLCTVVYFHQYTHKVVGAAVGTFAWYLTYGSWYRQPWSPGRPGTGLFTRPRPGPKHD
ncbi:fat storage-inducing transmembrane protein 1 isoform X2 [Ornithorhynchus anatinus]|uniref:fat storage-inducing transmembrane protein 1 isoform X2 n=1 Tax=Ornithorhynchus anatinus TaxID=9258 RepID=UPI0010A8D9BE|nr:fat storage-inducing transmembrane protein 1 isoform X2 [Ornithorhynchus anatinus]